MPDDHQAVFGWSWFAATLAAAAVLYGTAAPPNGLRYVIELVIAIGVGYGAAWMVVALAFGPGPGIGPPGNPD